MHLLELVAKTAYIFLAIFRCNCLAIAIDLGHVKSFLNVVVGAYLIRHYESLPRVFSFNLAIFLKFIIKTVKFAFVGIIDFILSILYDKVDFLLIAVEFRRFSFDLF
jgi:hypothetical protein